MGRAVQATVLGEATGSWLACGGTVAALAPRPHTSPPCAASRWSRDCRRRSSRGDAAYTRLRRPVKWRREVSGRHRSINRSTPSYCVEGDAMSWLLFGMAEHHLLV